MRKRVTFNKKLMIRLIPGRHTKKCITTNMVRKCNLKYGKYKKRTIKRK